MAGYALLKAYPMVPLSCRYNLAIPYGTMKTLAAVYSKTIYSSLLNFYSSS